MQAHFVNPFQALADPSRRHILHLLSKEELSINSLAGNFDMSRPAVSKHVKILYSAGLISIEERGRERFCTLKREGFTEIQEWINYYDQFWNHKLDALEKFLLATEVKSNSKTSK